MHVCMNVCMDVCVCVCLCVYVYICTCACTPDSSNSTTTGKWKYRPGPSLVCSAMVCHLWQAGGLVPPGINCPEFTPLDVYQLKVFAPDVAPLPKNCQQLDTIGINYKTKVIYEQKFSQRLQRQIFVPGLRLAALGLSSIRSRRAERSSCSSCMQERSLLLIARNDLVRVAAVCCGDSGFGGNQF